MANFIKTMANFSEGRDLDKIERIVAPFRGKEGVKLLDYQRDHDHNRLVVTVVGASDSLRDAVVESIGVAVDTEHGLLVPVIHDADVKSIFDVAAELADLAERARNRKLDAADMRATASLNTWRPFITTAVCSPASAVARLNGRC